MSSGEESSYFGYSDVVLYEKVLFIIYAVISACLFAVQLKFLKTVKVFAIYLLPLISFSICFVSVVLYHGKTMDASNSAAKAASVFRSLIVPLLVVVLYELPLRLHEVEFVHFLVIPFDEVTPEIKSIGKLTCWIIRFIAGGLFIMPMLVFFGAVVDDTAEHATHGGYEYLAKHKLSVATWLSLIPCIFLSIEALVIGFAMKRFGNYHSIKIGHSKRWLLLLIGAFCQIASISFGHHVFRVTSIAGDLALLLAATFMTKFMVSELVTLGNFADFLRQSNIAFSQSRAKDSSNSPDDDLESLDNMSNSDMSSVGGNIEMSTLIVEVEDIETTFPVSSTYDSTTNRNSMALDHASAGDMIPKFDEDSIIHKPVIQNNKVGSYR